MKNALLLILFLFPIFCLAQNWGTKNSVWHYNQTMFEPPFNYDFIKFSVLGDTVIVGEDATIFQEDYFSLKDTVSSKLLMKSIDNRVYFFEPTLNAFQLLYDFNAVAGDTIQMFCRDEGNETYIKVKVDSVSKRNMNGTELKVQHVSTLQSSEYKYQMNGEIIENIGWTGFMFPLHRLADPPYGGNLRCFQNDDFELKLVDIDCDFFGPTQFKTEWASIGAKWHYTKMEGMMPPNEGYVLYEVIKDTVIQNKTVREIQKTYFHANGQDTTYLKSDFTYTENGIVYFYGNGSFYQLYNFNAVAGDKWTIYGTDSICSFFNTDSIGTVIVDSVKTVLVNGWPLKAIYTSPDSLSEWFYSEVILERIGCLDHMLPRAINCAVDVIPGNGSLRCFEHPALGFFTNNCCNPSPSFCERLVFYNGIDELQINFSVYPNPAHDFLNVHNIAGNHEKMQVKLYNVNMQLVYIKSIFANQLSIPILGFQPGLYFVEVSTLKESFRKKIIVQ